ncbi:transglutaminase domain-containing protein [Phytomonospora sp. NPDC050363]|uniref:transglutaminase domain-containing protein n=1 Tax=Phytomonospora sp. NPDC050363 TaxID=3155642 RepID=UPI00340228D6
MRADIPPPPLRLLDWPTAAPSLPLRTDRLPPDREALLLERLPERLPTAWDTALLLMEWTTTRWKHANDQTGIGMDAVKLLEAVDDGRRFRCVEYSTVLTQALNAVGIPALGANGYTRDHHFGIGRGHRFTEAWIDDIAAGVVLDGQNGLYWHDGGRPLGLAELLTMHRAGSAPPST